MPEWMKESSTSFEPNKKKPLCLKSKRNPFLLNKFQVSGKRNKTILSDIHPAIQLIVLFTNCFNQHNTKSSCFVALRHLPRHVTFS